MIRKQDEQFKSFEMRIRNSPNHCADLCSFFKKLVSYKVVVGAGAAYKILSGAPSASMGFTRKGIQL
jgi:hypothetical protein